MWGRLLVTEYRSGKCAFIDFRSVNRKRWNSRDLTENVTPKITDNSVLHNYLSGEKCIQVHCNHSLMHIRFNNHNISLYSYIVYWFTNNRILIHCTNEKIMRPDDIHQKIEVITWITTPQHYGHIQFALKTTTILCIGLYLFSNP